MYFQRYVAEPTQYSTLWAVLLLILLMIILSVVTYMLVQYMSDLFDICYKNIIDIL